MEERVLVPDTKAAAFARQRSNAAPKHFASNDTRATKSLNIGLVRQ
jgi:hypothetical protein